MPLPIHVPIPMSMPTPVPMPIHILLHIPIPIQIPIQIPIPIQILIHILKSWFFSQKRPVFDPKRNLPANSRFSKIGRAFHNIPKSIVFEVPAPRPPKLTTVVHFDASSPKNQRQLHILRLRTQKNVDSCTLWCLAPPKLATVAHFEASSPRSWRQLRILRHRTQKFVDSCTFWGLENLG